MSQFLTDLSQAFTALVRSSAPSVVAVHAKRARHSGFVWKPGLVVTAEEPLAEEGELEVEVSSGDRFPAQSIGRDPSTDVALLRVEGLPGAPAAFAGAPVETGVLVLALAAGPTASLGIVARAGPAWRSMRGGEIDARLEIDILLRREAEGGLAIGTDGHALGMLVSGPRRRTLVIPGATVARTAALLERHGRVPRGYLGFGLQPARSDDGDSPAAMVISVDRNGPAAAAGIQQGDLIIGWDGQPPVRIDHMIRALGPASVGHPLALALRRGGSAIDVILVVGERIEP